MIRTYQYELWNGKKVVGTYTTPYRLMGLHTLVSEHSTLKQFYRQKLKVIKVPIITRIILDDGVDITVRRCLDVRRKSKRQLELLIKGGGTL